MVAGTMQTETIESAFTRGLDMQLLHCTECHHEWVGLKGESCDWCQAPGKVIEDSTPLGRMIRDWMQKDGTIKDSPRSRNQRAVR